MGQKIAMGDSPLLDSLVAWNRIYHRFTLDEKDDIQALRLFKVSNPAVRASVGVA